MARLSVETRLLVVLLLSHGHTIASIQRRLKEENITAAISNDNLNTTCQPASTCSLHGPESVKNTRDALLE